MKMLKSPSYNRVKTYRCENDECPYFIKYNRKRRKTLFKAHLEGNSYVTDRCTVCNTDRHVGEEKEEKIDNKPIDALKYLRNHAND
jgi:fructosamine-3-kinase